MKVFTYKQYIECIHTLRLNAVLQLAEEGEEYHLENIEKKYTHDKLIKDILTDIEEAQKFINDFIEPKRTIDISTLERYKNNYLDKKYTKKEANLIYKLKNKEIFFLIEYQTKIENSIKQKLLNKCIDIMQEWCRSKKYKKMTQYPIVVPIVIYTGNEKWKEQKETMKKCIYERYGINLEYNLIDINKISKEVLLEKNTMFGYVMLLQKSENKIELMDNLSIIKKASKNQEKVEELIKKIKYLLYDVSDKEIKQEIDKKVGDYTMSTLYDRILNENKRMIKIGETKSKKEIAKKMINKNIEEKIILETTGIKKEELETIKNELLEAG